VENILQQINLKSKYLCSSRFHSNTCFIYRLAFLTDGANRQFCDVDIVASAQQEHDGVGDVFSFECWHVGKHSCHFVSLATYGDDISGGVAR
jgi:hypothetical protein